MTVARTVEILADLVALPTIPGQKNAQWLAYVAALLEQIGARVHHVPAPDGSCTGLVASVGPDVPGGIVLSGHVDVVDVAGQDWTRPAFRLTDEGQKLFGRGTTDMKGFVACALSVMEQAEGLHHPLHIALSADEESLCQSAISLAAHLAGTLPPVRGVLVGEPTGLRPVNRHKGSYTCEVVVTGRSAHASVPEQGLSATALAAHLIAWIDDRSARVSSLDATTFTIGTLHGGIANNIIAEHCQFEWDIRLAPGGDLAQVIAEAEAYAAQILEARRGPVQEGAITIRPTASFPGLATSADHPFAKGCLRVARAQHCETAPFGTEAGIFQAAGLPAMVMGPGDIAQAHIPDEYIDRSQLEECLAQLTQFANGEDA